MKPRPSIFNFANALSGDIKLFSYISTSNPIGNKFFYFENINFFEFCLIIFGSILVSISSLKNPIVNVVLRSSFSKMGRVAANWIIASMQNQFFGSYISKCINKRKSVGGNLNSFNVMRSVTLACWPNPNPTWAKIGGMFRYRPIFINSFPKSLLGSFEAMNFRIVNRGRYCDYRVSNLIHVIYELICQTRKQNQLSASRFNLNQ